MNEVVETPVEKPVQNIVVLNNGETANFGVRNQILSSFDTEEGTITFKVLTGEVLSLDVKAIEGLGYESATELGQQVIMAGLLGKIKSNLAPVKLTTEVEVKDEEGNVVSTETVNSLAIAIQKEMDKLAKGIFSVRAGSNDAVELTVDQKAFATATVNHPIFAKVVGTEAYASKWTNLDEASVIAEVDAVWEQIGKDGRRTAKKHPYFMLEKSLAEVAALQA